MATTPDLETVRKTLALTVDNPQGSGTVTIREYLFMLLRQLWIELDEFYGKYPLGNSGWDWDLYVPMIREGLIRGEVDEDGYIVDVDDKAGHAIILAAIDELAHPSA